MKISIFHAEAGHGHAKVAEVIRNAFLARGVAAGDVTLEDALDATPFFFRRLYPAAYFYSVKYTPSLWGWFYERLDRPRVYGCFRPFRHFANRLMGNALLERVIRETPDVVIATHFFSAQLFAQAKREGTLKARLITVITDFYPHTFWVNDGTDFYWVMGEESRKALQKHGVPPEKIAAGGIPVDGRFKPSGRKREFLAKWGFTNDRLTILMTGGSFGLGPVESLLQECEAFKERIQCFVVCAHNADLHAALERKNFPFPVRVFGFVDFMADLMEASDLLIAKPGGSTTTEAIVKGLPMVVLRPIPGQEARNAMLLKEHNAAFFMEKPEQIKPILQTVLNAPEILESKKRALQKLAKPHAAEDLVTFAVKDVP